MDLIEYLIGTIAKIIKTIFSWFMTFFEFIISLPFYLFGLSQERKYEKKISNLLSSMDKALSDNKQQLSWAENMLNQVQNVSTNQNHKNLLDEFKENCERFEKTVTPIKNDLEKKLNSDNFTGQSKKLYRQFKDVWRTLDGRPDRNNHLEFANFDVIYDEYHNFINSLLSFAKVEKLRMNSLSSWEYSKNGVDFLLQLGDEDTAGEKTVTIKATPKHSIIAEDNSFCYDSSDTIVSFVNGHLQYTRKCQFSELDHYDVYEFFTSADHLMRKQVSNDYSQSLEMRTNEAKNWITNLPALNLETVAPPPGDNVPEKEKLPDARARWAQLSDLQSAGVLEPKGFLLGRMGYGSYIYTGDYNSHIMTIASAGSGKGVGVVIPNLLRHKGSVVVLDPKAENFMVTSQFRLKYGDVYYFDPYGVLENYISRGLNRADTIKARINPMDLVDPYNDRDGYIDQATLIASSLVSCPADAGDATFFYQEAQGFLKNAICYIALLYPLGHPERNLLTVRKKVAMEFPLLKDDLIRERRGQPWANELPIVELIGWLGKVVAAHSNAKAHVMQGTDFLTNPKVADYLSKSNVDLSQLRSHCMSLYLIWDVDRLLHAPNQCKPLIRLLFSLTIKGAGNYKVEMSPTNAQNKILFMLDEIAQLGTVEILQPLLTLQRGAGLVAWTIWQSLSQINSIYGEQVAKTLFNNCAVKQFFGVNDLDTAKMVSEYAGATTYYKVSQNLSEAQNTATSYVDQFGFTHSFGVSKTTGTSSSNSYHGCDYTSTTGENQNFTTTKNQTNSYSFSKSIQHGHTWTKGQVVTPEKAQLVTPVDVMNSIAYGVQFVFYRDKVPFPILSGKIRYYEEPEFEGEWKENLTRNQ